jgi:hypothetical protein
VFTDVGGADCGGGAVMAAQPWPGVFGWGVGADAGTEEQAATKTAAQRVLIMAASVAARGLHGRERNR